jgi:hypothetical protein
MKFLDKIEDFNVLETIFNEDMNKEKSKINNKVIKKIQKPKS